MNTVPFIDLKEQHTRLRDEVLRAVAGVLDSQQFVLKEHVAELEKEIARRTGSKHAIGVASGSDALFLVLKALGVGPGDEVITTPFTFFASAGSVSRAGAKPVFADVLAGTFNLDAASVKAKITPKTKAIVAVHLFGLSADLDALRAVAEPKGIAIVEDAAQSYGATYKGKVTGSIGAAGCLSFFPTKNLGGAGDGGMVLTQSDAIADAVKLLRVHGSKKKYHHDVIGINSRLDELQAAILEVKLKHVDEWNEARRRHAALYAKELAGLPLELPVEPEGTKHVYHLYTVRTPKRDALAQHLADRGISTGIYYPVPLHLQPCYKDLGYKKGDLPVSERLADEAISLPMYPELKQDDLKRVVSAVRDFFGA